MGMWLLSSPALALLLCVTGCGPGWEESPGFLELLAGNSGCSPVTSGEATRVRELLAQNHSVLDWHHRVEFYQSLSDPHRRASPEPPQLAVSLPSCIPEDEVDSIFLATDIDDRTDLYQLVRAAGGRSYDLTHIAIGPTYYCCPSALSIRVSRGVTSADALRDALRFAQILLNTTVWEHAAEDFFRVWEGRLGSSFCRHLAIETPRLAREEVFHSGPLNREPVTTMPGRFAVDHLARTLATIPAVETPVDGEVSRVFGLWFAAEHRDRDQWRYSAGYGALRAAAVLGDSRLLPLLLEEAGDDYYQVMRDLAIAAMDAIRQPAAPLSVMLERQEQTTSSIMQRHHP